MITEQEIAEIRERMRVSGHRCPHCKSTNLTSGMTGHRCLDCGGTCLYGEEHISIAREAEEQKKGVIVGADTLIGQLLQVSNARA